MTRTIKFRGQRLNSDEWAYGLLQMDSTGHPGRISAEWDDEGIERFGTFDVVKETIGQLIGLQDKYKNDIYEGDIIDAPGHCGIAEVVYNHPYNAAFCVGSMLLGVIDYSDIEVIGNKFEHPHLLQNKVV